MMRCSVGWDEQDCWKLASARGPRPCKGFWMDMKKCWWVRACLRRCEKEQLLLFLLAPGLYEGEDQRADQYNQQDDLHCAKSLFFLHPFPRCLIRICNQSYNFLPAKGRCWHLSVSATRLRRYSFAVSRDARRRIPTTHPHRSRPYAAFIASDAVGEATSVRFLAPYRRCSAYHLHLQKARRGNDVKYRTR